MIRNDREYRITKAQAAGFEKSLAALDADVTSPVHPKIRKAQTDAMRSQLADLRAEIADYEALRDGRRGVVELSSLNELPRALIEGRIAAGLTQSELAERLGIPEQQVQRYEATNYASTSFARLVEVANAVGVKVREDVFLSPTEVSERALVQRLGDVGIDRDFVRRVLLNEREDQEDEAAPVLRATSAIQRIFGWTPKEILVGREALRASHAAQAAMFKVYSSADEGRTLFLAAFGEYVAKLVLRATPKLQSQKIPSDAASFRDLLVRKSGKVDLATAVATLWELGVPVVPLVESGGYHGACWRFGGRSIVVLKQRTASEARWLHDLLHEAHHAASDPEKREFAWLDDESMPVDRRLAPEEKRATRFAGDVELNGRAEELARECVASAEKRAERLKGVVPKVAKAHGVSTGALANYLAWRLAMDGVNWWGAAANLQEGNGEPWRVVRDFLVQRLDWSQFDQLDRELLMKALQEVSK
jgi:transcriptional regulator with XRE-family HTH domain